MNFTMSAAAYAPIEAERPLLWWETDPEYAADPQPTTIRLEQQQAAAIERIRKDQAALNTIEEQQEKNQARIKMLTIAIAILGIGAILK